MKAKRWVMVYKDHATDLAITTPNGKRLKVTTIAEVCSYYNIPQGAKLYPMTCEIRVTPRAPHAETQGEKV